MSKIQIQVESPIKNYEFADVDGNDLGSLSFIPTDFDAYDRLEEFEGLINEALSSLGDTDHMGDKELMGKKNLLNEKIKGVFDYVLATDTKDIFEIVKPLTVFNDGKIWFLLVMFNVFSIVENETGKSTAKLKEGMQKNNIDKYLNKYKVPGKRPGRK